MLLDQQVPISWAFAGPARLAERLGDRFSASGLASLELEALEAAFKAKPAVHRFPAAMARRAHELARYLVEHHDGDAGALWHAVPDAAELFRRVSALPGFGDEKARIFVALLAKRFGVRPAGWEAASHPFSDDQPRSVADMGSPEAVEAVKAWKKAMRAAGRSKQDSPD